jgi:hypothetical protein
MKYILILSLMFGPSFAKADELSIARLNVQHAKEYENNLKEIYEDAKFSANVYTSIAVVSSLILGGAYIAGNSLLVGMAEGFAYAIADAGKANLARNLLIVSGTAVVVGGFQTYRIYDEVYRLTLRDGTNIEFTLEDVEDLKITLDELEENLYTELQSMPLEQSFSFRLWDGLTNGRAEQDFLEKRYVLAKAIREVKEVKLLAVEIEVSLKDL